MVVAIHVVPLHGKNKYFYLCSFLFEAVRVKQKMEAADKLFLCRLTESF